MSAPDANDVPTLELPAIRQPSPELVCDVLAMVLVVVGLLWML